MNILDKANKVYLDNFEPTTWFEKCVFLSWYCDVGDCKFCFRSIQKSKIKSAISARRSIPSILAEVYLCKRLGWQLEFLTGGYRMLPFDELVNIVRFVYEIYGEKIWINLGALSVSELEKLRPYVKGICGSIETVNKNLHKKICPSKPVEPYLEMFDYAKDFDKGVAIVIGLGENIDDIKGLFKIIENYNIDKVDFYPLHPIKGTPYTEGPDSDYYAEWIARTRIRFPRIKIVAGTWVGRVSEVSLLLRAGANSITKFPAIRKFNSKEARILEEEVKKSGRSFKSTLTKLPKIDNDLNDEINFKIKQYIRVMDKLKN